MVSADQRNYLMSLIRMDIRKKKRNLDKCLPRPGQSEQEYTEVLSRFMGNLRFAEEAYRALGGDPDSITNVTDQ